MLTIWHLKPGHHQLWYWFISDKFFCVFRCIIDVCSECLYLHTCYHRVHVYGSFIYNTVASEAVVSRFLIYWKWQFYVSLTHCGLVMPYEILYLDQPWSNMACCLTATRYHLNQCLLINQSWEHIQIKFQSKFIVFHEKQIYLEVSSAT